MNSYGYGTRSDCAEDGESDAGSTWSENAELEKLRLHGRHRNGEQWFKVDFKTKDPEEYKASLMALKAIRENYDPKNKDRFNIPSIQSMDRLSERLPRIMPGFDAPLRNMPNNEPYPYPTSYDSTSSLYENRARGDGNLNIEVNPASDQLGEGDPIYYNR